MPPLPTIPLTLAGPGHTHAPTSLTDTTDTWPTWSETFQVLTLQAGYNTTTVLISTTLLGIAAGIIGVFTLLRKRALMSDALAHATLPGIAGAFIAAALLGFNGRSLPVLLAGATVTGVLGVLTVQWLVRHTRLREDASIGLVLSVFFGAGAVLLSLIQTMQTGNAAGLTGFIYGKTATLSADDARLMAGIAVAAVVATGLLLKEFSLVCFNDAFAKVDGWPVSVIDLLMMSLVVIVTVAGLQAVGLILVVAMLIIPAVSARFWTQRVGVLVLLAALIGGLCGYLGSAISALLPRQPAGAVIVLTSGVIFLFSMLVAPSRGILAAALRRLRLKLGIAADHLLELAYLTYRDRPPGSPGGPVHANAIDQLKRKRGWGPLTSLLVNLHLARRGLGRSSDGYFVPSPAGLERGRQVCRNHRLWEQYLVSYADIAPSHLDWTVDQVEHVLSGEIVLELEAALQTNGIDLHRAHPAHPGVPA
ncbi:MAG: iron chelate uptake ABC transporter family permease subunit [Planctomycetota bacterium]